MMRRTLSIVVVILASGCGFFSRSQSRIYSLDRVAPAAAPAARSGLPVGLDGVELPPGFDRKEIVVRKTNQQLDVRSAEQWNASLEPLVLHTLAYDLASRLPLGMMILPGEPKPPSQVRTIDVAFEDFSAGPDAKITVDAHWIVKEPGRPDIAAHDRFTVSIPGLDSASVAAGTSQALGALADRIVASL